jgi:predicted nucleic acid-binding protein
VGALNLAEALDVLVRLQGWLVDEVEEKLRWLILGGLEVVSVDAAIALSAGRLHARHYHRTRRPVSLADCTALATAIARQERLATSDPALLAAARDEGCPVVPLPDARGNRPSVGS